jgi:hypothetical protein
MLPDPVQLLIIKKQLIKTFRSATHYNGEAEDGSGRPVRVADFGRSASYSSASGPRRHFYFYAVDVPFAGCN